MRGRLKRGLKRRRQPAQSEHTEDSPHVSAERQREETVLSRSLAAGGGLAIYEFDDERS
eukprot:SAG31_NODE_22670_length_520_cov_0.978622_1_plen_58_part_01